MRDELGGKIKTELAALRPKIYCYLINGSDESKKQRTPKVCH